MLKRLVVMSIYFLEVRKNATILRNNVNLMFKFGVDCIFTSWWKNKLLQHMTKVKDNIYNSTKMYNHIYIECLQFILHCAKRVIYFNLI